MAHAWSRDVSSDAELVLRARDGEKRAFAELVLRHWDTARSLAERMLGDPDLARDASQEATVIALVSLDRLARPERFGSWLAGIALNVARRMLRELRGIDPAYDTELIDSAPGPDELAEAALIRKRVRDAVADLAPGQRQAVLLFYLLGLTHREVAAELGISIGAVKARLHQARAALATSLAEFGAPKEVTVMPEPQSTAAQWVDVTVAEVRRASGDDPMRRPHVMILRELAGERRMMIWIGGSEATALALSLESEETVRPNTYRFAAGLLAAAGSRVKEVRISRLVDGVYYAVVVTAGPAGPGEVDARPSDALNLAVILGMPIRVDNQLFAEQEMNAGNEWMRDYPTSAADLAAEAREREAQTFARRREHDKRP